MCLMKSKILHANDAQRFSQAHVHLYIACKSRSLPDIIQPNIVAANGQCQNSDSVQLKVQDSKVPQEWVIDGDIRYIIPSVKSISAASFLDVAK